MIIQLQEGKWLSGSLLCLSTARNWGIGYKLFYAGEVRKKEETAYPRKYQDYTVQIHEEMIPDSVEMKRMI